MRLSKLVKTLFFLQHNSRPIETQGSFAGLNGKHPSELSSEELQWWLHQPNPNRLETMDATQMDDLLRRQWNTLSSRVYGFCSYYGISTKGMPKKFWEDSTLHRKLLAIIHLATQALEKQIPLKRPEKEKSSGGQLDSEYYYQYFPKVMMNGVQVPKKGMPVDRISCAIFSKIGVVCHRVVQLEDLSASKTYSLLQKLNHLGNLIDIRRAEEEQHRSAAAQRALDNG